MLFKQRSRRSHYCDRAKFHRNPELSNVTEGKMSGFRSREHSGQSHPMPREIAPLRSQ
jgi:hypothetical protein